MIGSWDRGASTFIVRSLITATKMNSDHFFSKVTTYADLSEASKESWQKLLREESYKKGRYFIELGQAPKKSRVCSKGFVVSKLHFRIGRHDHQVFLPGRKVRRVRWGDAFR